MPVLKGIKSCLLVAMIAFAPNAAAATPSQIDSAHLKGLQWLLTNQDGDGGWPNASGIRIIATTSSLDALAQAGIKGYPYAKGVSWLANADAASTDALARQTLSLFRAGVNTSGLISLLTARRNEDAASLSWGAYDHYAGSFPDTSLALDVIKITGTIYATVGNGISYVTSKQNTDGGWPFTKSEPTTAQSQVIPTAYNILTLSRYKALYSVQTNLNNAITWLKSQQKAGGGFGEGTSGTVLETALAYQAIVAEKGTADPAAILAQDFLIAQQSTTNGNWGGDAFTTAQVLKTFQATVLLDTDADGIPDEIETLMGTNAFVADSRWLAAEGNGQSIPGVTTPTVLNNSTVVNQPFGFTLAGIGTGPFTWTISSGNLPPGLSLNSSTGVISGTPTATGNYSFEYTVTDANGVATNVLAQFDVLSSSGGRDGDLNGDGVVDVADVFLAERIALGLITPTANQLTHGDVAPAGAPDGVVNIADVVRIRRKALGLEGF